MTLTNNSYNRGDIHNIIVINQLCCKECYKKMWFNLNDYTIEYCADAVGPQLILECRTCYHKNSFHIFNLKRPTPRDEGSDREMCYTGKCKYEDHMGECNFSSIQDIPQDAGCVQKDLFMLQEELINDYKKVLDKNYKPEPLIKTKIEEEDSLYDPFEETWK